jgi:hypothetical protein
MKPSSYSKNKEVKLASRIYTGEHVIGDDNYLLHCDGGQHSQGQSFGYVPRPQIAQPGSYRGSIQTVNIPLIPRSEWSARIKEKEQNKSQLSDIIRAQGIPSLDQNGKGYCWAHSTVGAVMFLRAAQGMPYVPLSAYAIACKIKNFRDEGGWGALSMDFAMQNGIPSQAKWPQQSMSRSNDNADTWADAATRKVASGWIDIAAAVYDRNLTFDQVATLLLCNIPVVGDFNWWGHSVCLVDLVEVSPGVYGIRFRNSWGDSYGEQGFSILKDNKMVPNGAVAPTVVYEGLAA